MGQLVLNLFHNNLFNIIVFVVMVALGLGFGSHAERKHLAQLRENEQQLGHIIISNERRVRIHTDDEPVLLVGSVVIAQDYFKAVVADILSLFGKNITTFETLLERARREAVIRLKQQANDYGYHHVYGLRFETTEIQGGFEVLAYGTAVHPR